MIFYLIGNAIETICCHCERWFRTPEQVMIGGIHNDFTVRITMFPTSRSRSQEFFHAVNLIL